MRKIGALGVGFLLMACGATTNGQPPPAAGGNLKLFEAAGTQIAVIDARSHEIERRLPLGVPSSDWKHLYSIDGSSLLDTSPATGAIANAVALGGRYQLPPATVAGLPGGLSPNGRWLVAEGFDGGTGATPTASRFALVDTQAAHVAKTFKLTGYFHYDAISNDGLRLYLIQILNGKEYYVRLFDIAAGRLDQNIVVDKSNGEAPMTGLRLAGVASPYGNRLFSMYVRESDQPFIHALSLDASVAFCLDLPGGGYANNEAERHWSIAMNSFGTRLFAVNAATGLVAQIDTAQEFNPQIKRTRHIAGGKSAAGGASTAILSRDGASLVTAGPTGIIWIDTATLTVRRHGLESWNVWSLALSPDGQTVYAVSDQGEIAEVSMATGALISRYSPGAGRPLALMRVAAA